MKTIHFISGLLIILIFIGTGQYLKFTLPPFDGTLDGNRMMYRASHVYLMMSGAINMIAGCYFTQFKTSIQIWAQRIGSIMILLSQPVLFLAFVIEPANNMVERTYTISGCLLLLGGTFITVLAYSCQSVKTR